MAKEQGPLSGFRDQLPAQMLPRQKALDTIKGVYESYGFTPLDTPHVERKETLDGKYGEEGQKLMYQFEDHGGRELALRYDLTVPLARVVAQHGADIPMPFKRYQIGEVFRGESPQAGRYREFTQFDADTVGTKSATADAEVVVMMADAMEALGADAKIRVNNRRILDALVDKSGTQDDAAGHIGVVDKVEKIGEKAALDEISEKYGDRAARVTQEYLSVSGSTEQRLSGLDNLLDGHDGAEEGIDNLQTVFKMVRKGTGRTSDEIDFDQTIARGLSYYTGIVYETMLKDLPQIGSVNSGGRYDNLVRDMGGPDLPAVGTSIGVDRLLTGLAELNPEEARKTPSEVMVINFGDDHAAEYLGIANKLRKSGIPTEIHYEPTRVKRQLRDANQLGVPYVILAGPQELGEESAKIRDMKTGNETTVPLNELPQSLAQMKNEQ
jgi:histidyl-tRNA synthetase